MMVMANSDASVDLMMRELEAIRPGVSIVCEREFATRTDWVHVRGGIEPKRFAINIFDAPGAWKDTISKVVAYLRDSITEDPMELAQLLDALYSEASDDDQVCVPGRI